MARISLRSSHITNLYFIKLAELSEVIAQQRHFAAIRRGLLLCMPLIVMGSFANLFINLPIPAYQEGMSYCLGLGWKTLGNAIYTATFAIISVLLSVAISYFLAESSSGKKNNVHPAMAATVSLACLVAVVQPRSFEGIIGIPLAWLGVPGLLLAIISAVTATELFLYFSSKKAFDISIFSDEADPVIAQAVSAIIPAGFTVFLFAFVKFVVMSCGIFDIHQLIYDCIKRPFVDLPNTLGTTVLYHAMTQLLWFFGIHGQNVLDAINKSVFDVADFYNVAMYRAGQQPVEFFTSSVTGAYATIGGTGSTLCLVIAILLVKRQGNTAWLAKLSILPGLFNINELLVFGLPIVLNPLFFIPFFITPVCQTLLAYMAMKAGLVPLTSNIFNWTTPVFLSGYVATRSFEGPILQAVLIFVGVLIYLPFVRLANQQKTLKMQQALDDLCKLAINGNIGANMLTKRDIVGNLFRVLAHDLREALDEKALALKYQPQINQENQVTGVEALLRWKHKVFGQLPPPLVIAIAEETGLIHSLGKWVIDTACQQLKVWQDKQVDVIMSVNVSATQFYQEDILEHISSALSRTGIKPNCLEIEITESIAMNDDARTKERLQRIHEMGVRIAIDDFGMGHSSLNYIKNFPVDTLKIDKSLSVDIIKEKNCKEIVASIIALCASLNIKTVVEYVETAEQRDVLKELGSVHYQGYLYSPAIEPDKAYQFILELNRR